MGAFSTYKGARLNLISYQGKSSIDYPIEVLTDFDTAFDLSVYSSVLFKIYYRKHGEFILTPTTSTASNFIYLDITKAQSAALQTREYWYECYGVLVSPVSEEELICFGVFKND